MAVKVNPWRILDEHAKALSYFKIAVIGAILSLAVTLANNERTDDRVQALARQIAREQVILEREVDRKAAALAAARQEADREQTRDLRNAFNRGACGFQKLADDAIKRSRKALADPTATAGTKDRNRQALKDAREFKMDHQPIPPGFDCSRLPEPPPP